MWGCEFSLKLRPTVMALSNIKRLIGGIRLDNSSDCLSDWLAFHGCSLYASLLLFKITLSDYFGLWVILLPLPSYNLAACHEDILRRGGIAPRIYTLWIDGGERSSSRPGCFSRGKSSFPDTQWIGPHIWSGRWGEENRTLISWSSGP